MSKYRRRIQGAVAVPEEQRSDGQFHSIMALIQLADNIICSQRHKKSFDVEGWSFKQVKYMLFQLASGIINELEKVSPGKNATHNQANALSTLRMLVESAYTKPDFMNKDRTFHDAVMDFTESALSEYIPEDVLPAVLEQISTIGRNGKPTALLQDILDGSTKKKKDTYNIDDLNLDGLAEF